MIHTPDLRQAFELFNSGNNETRQQINQMLWQIVPFNQPHKIEVTEWQPQKVSAKIPHIGQNFNHLQGVHACGLATVAEYVSGLTLLTVLGIQKYRLIMAKLEVEYTYQARTDCFAEFSISDEELHSQIITPLQSDDKTVFPAKVTVKDTGNNIVCHATIYWQIKNWEKVNLK